MCALKIFTRITFHWPLLHQLLKLMPMYMHTIDGKPAEFRSGGICFARKSVKLVKTLPHIKTQQSIARKMDAKNGCAGCFNYGYLTLKIENDPPRDKSSRR